MSAPTETRLAPEDLLEISDRPMPELVDGQLVERDMGQRADAVAARICAELVVYCKTGVPGLVNGSQCGYQIFPDDPTKVRIPDVSFTKKERLQEPGGSEGHAKIPPDLAVEVISPSDQARDLRIKVKDYLDAGVPMIWVANPDDRTVEVYHADGSARLLGPEQVLEGGTVLPGFHCRVAELFEE